MVYPGNLFIGDNGVFLCIPMKLESDSSTDFPHGTTASYCGRIAIRLVDMAR